MTTRTYYVSAVDGSDVDNGSTWALAKATVAGALAQCVTDGGTTGDIAYIYLDHTGTHVQGGTLTWTFGNNQTFILISVNRSSGDAWTFGASETVGSASNAFSISPGDGTSIWCWGLQLDAGTNTNSACDLNIANSNSTASRSEFVNCKLRLLSASTAGARLTFGHTGGASTNRQSTIVVRDTELVLPSRTADAPFVLGQARIEMVNITLSYNGASKPPALFQFATTTPCEAVIRDSDLSGFNTTSGAYFEVGSFAVGSVLVKNCKLSGTPSLVSGSWPNGNGSLTLRNVDSGDTINVFEYRNRLGTLIEDTATYAGSGFTFNGVAASWQITTTAECNEANPFVLPVIARWNTVTTAQTAKIEILRDSLTNLTDREVWLELSYPASASFPNYTAASDRNANPFTGTAADQTTSAVVWTEALTNDNEQTLSVAFTAAEVGLLEGRVNIAKASTTLYVDPLLRVA